MRAGNPEIVWRLQGRSPFARRKGAARSKIIASSPSTSRAIWRGDVMRRIGDSESSLTESFRREASTSLPASVLHAGRRVYLRRPGQRVERRSRPSRRSREAGNGCRSAFSSWWRTALRLPQVDRKPIGSGSAEKQREPLSDQAGRQRRANPKKQDSTVCLANLREGSFTI